MRVAQTVGNFVAFILLGLSGSVFAQGPQGPQAAAVAPSSGRALEIECAANDVQERLPVKVRIKILSTTQIEARGFDKSGSESPSSLMRRSELPDQSRAAVFMMGGMLGVSGNAKMLIARTALELGEVGTILILNQSTGENIAYLCAKLP